MKKISVIGAAGGLGLALCKYLSGLNKYRLRACAAPWNAENRIAELKTCASEIFTGDITKPEEADKMIAGADFAVNCAAALADTNDKHYQFSVNVRGNEILLKAAKKHNLEKLIVISTAGVASNFGKGENSESSPFRSKLQNYHVWSKIENEKMLARLSQELNYPCIIIRPASIYGPHMLFRWGEIINYLKKGKLKVFDAPSALYPLIYETDLARAIELAISRAELKKNNEIFIISSDEKTALSGILNFIAKKINAPRPKRIPYWPVLAGSYMLKCIPSFLKPKRFKLLSPWSVREYRYGHWYQTEKAKKVLGFTAEIPFEEGMSQVLKNLE